MNFRRILGVLRLTPKDKETLARVEPPQPLPMQPTITRLPVILPATHTPSVIVHHTTIHCENFRL